MYVDDVGGVSASEERANDDLSELLALLGDMGLPVSLNKVVRPTRRGETLGGELDLDAKRVVLSENFIWKLKFRKDALVKAPQIYRRLRHLETLVYMHAHVGLFHPGLKFDVSRSFAILQREAQHRHARLHPLRRLRPSL